MLVDFETLLALVPGDELDLRVGETLCRQVGKHLVPEEMGMNRLGYACPLAVFLDDLLDVTRCKRSAAPGFKKMTIFRACPEVAFQDEPEAGWEKNVAILGS